MKKGIILASLSLLLVTSLLLASCNSTTSTTSPAVANTTSTTVSALPITSSTKLRQLQHPRLLLLLLQRPVQEIGGIV